VDSTAAVPDSAKTPPAAPYGADTGQLVFDKDAGVFLLNAPLVAGLFGAVGANKVTSGPIDVELASSGRGWAAVLLTALDNQPIARSTRMLLSIPGYSLRALPAPGNRAPTAAAAQPQNLVHYPGTTDWWTVDRANSSNSAKPSGDMNGGWQPTFMERVEAWVTLRTAARSITVTPLDGAGNELDALPSSEIAPIRGGFRIHVNGDAQQSSPWFVISAVERHRGRRGAAR
jgi:hypothetical protein